jgi:hypothetical protein
MGEQLAREGGGVSRRPGGEEWTLVKNVTNFSQTSSVGLGTEYPHDRVVPGEAFVTLASQPDPPNSPRPHNVHTGAVCENWTKFAEQRTITFSDRSPLSYGLHTLPLEEQENRTAWWCLGDMNKLLSHLRGAL